MSVAPQRDDPTGSPDRLTDLVAEFVARLAPVHAVTATATDDVVQDLGYGSLTVVELEFALEELFELEPIAPDEAIGLRTVADLADYVRAQLAAGNGVSPTDETIELMRAQYPFSGQDRSDRASGAGG